jgi:hypothetical protein
VCLLIAPVSNVNEDYEVAYWTEELGISADRLKELVAKHGVMADVRKAVGKTD